MNRRLVAALLIMVIVIGGAYTLFFYYGEQQPDEPELIELTGELSENYGKVLIDEVNPATDSEHEFIELYTIGGYVDMEGWIVTSYDDDRLTLPKFSGTTEYLFVLLVADDGVNDLDMSDGQVVIYYGLGNQVLDIPGDEVGLHDSEGMLVSFMRYGGGNGDTVLGDWSAENDGLTLPSDSNYSLSLMGDIDDYEYSWIQTLATPGDPNVEVLQATGTFVDEEILLFNGIREYDMSGAFVRPPQARGENVTVTAGPGVNASVIDLVKEHINFSLNFFREHNFTDPATAAGNRINIRIVRSGSSESTGVSRSNGEIVIRVGRNATKEELKVVGEHELLHLFQFKRRTDANGSSYYPLHEPDYWWDEGMAEFWGVYSMLTNYPNITMAEWNEMARRIGSLNWHDHYRDLNLTGAFHGWDHSWHSYMASFLFIKYINETYGASVLMRVFNATRHYGAGDPRNTDPKAELAKALNMTWSELFGRFLAWLLLDAHGANGVPTFAPHIRLNYTGTAVGDTTGVRGGGGAVIEEIEVSNHTSFRIRLNYTGLATNWTVVVLIFYTDGTNESILVNLDELARRGEIEIDPKEPKEIRRIWVVKSVTEGPASGRITMEVIPNIEMTYNNATVGDTVLIEPNESMYEIIHVNSTQPFAIFLNWTTGNVSHWKFTIHRFWSDGTNDTYEVEIVNGTWPGYVVDPAEGTNSVTKLVIIKENLNETPVAVTMRITPSHEIPSNAFNPLGSIVPYRMIPHPWSGFGGLLGGYIFIESGMVYEILATDPIDRDFHGLILSSDLSLTVEFVITAGSESLLLDGFDAGLYYFVLFDELGEGIEWADVISYPA